MKVIFRKTVEGQAKVGEIKEVKPGYGRNYLLPQGLAELATPTKVREVEEEFSRLKRDEAKERAVAEERKQKIETLSLHFDREAGEDGTLFGTVTKQELAEAISEGIGEPIDRHEIELEPPRTLGEFTASYRISPSVHATIKAEVVRGGTDPETG